MTPEPAGAAPRSRATILVVEDEFLVALELESMLSVAGFAVLGPAASVAGALALLETCRPDAAVLDVNLRGESVSPVAASLARLQVPYLLASAYRKGDLPEGLRGVPNVGKPVDPARLVAALAALLPPGAA